MLHVGLTGSIASGKSTVARMFEEKGAVHIDLDQLAHDLEAPDQPVWREIVACFGIGILHPDRTINRVELGRIVFQEKDKLAQLNRIVHPVILAAWQRRIEEIRRVKPAAVILSDIPLLFETGKHTLVDLVLLVYVPPEEQIKRLMKRNGYSREEAMQRFASQMSIDEKRSLAQIVIDNQGPIEATRKIVDRVWQDLLELERKKRSGGNHADRVPA